LCFARIWRKKEERRKKIKISEEIKVKKEKEEA